MQTKHDATRRVAIGRGWETPSEKAPAETAVQVRSGQTVITGRLIGDVRQPRAFVWNDEAANTPKRELVICPDLQGSWLWEHGKETTLDAAFPDRKDIQRLDRKFRYWLDFLEQNWNAERSQRFFWARFHQEGLGLARRLQSLLVEEAVVRYWRPAQDPRGSTEREIGL